MRLVAALTALLAVAHAGNTIWVVPSTTKVTLEDKPPAAPATTASLHVLAGGSQSFQVAVSLPAGDTLDVSPGGEPSQQLSASWLKVVHVWCNASAVYASTPAWRPDVLLPPSSLPPLPMTLEGNTTHSFYVTYTPAASVQPGTYTSSFCLQQGALCVGVSVEVWGVKLPPLEASFPTLFNLFYTRDDDGATDLAEYYGGTLSPTMKAAYFDALCAAGIPPDNMYVETPRAWADIEALAACGAPMFGILDVSRAATGDVPLNYTSAQLGAVVSILAPVVSNLTRAGLLSRAYVYGFDEVHTAYVPAMRQMFSAVKAAYPALTTVAAVRWTPPTDLDLDVWVNLYSLWDPDTAEAWASSRPGRKAFAYHCISPRPNPPGGPTTFLNTFLEDPWMDARLLPWFAAQQGAQGWLYYLVDGWSFGNQHQVVTLLPGSTSKTNFSAVRYNNKAVPGDPGAFTNGDGILIYPGPSGPLLSARLANFRDGLHDVALLHNLNRTAIAEVTAGVLHYTRDVGVNTTSSWAVVEAARIAAARAVMGLV